MADPGNGPRGRSEGFKTSTGTIQFSPDRPIPAALITKLVKARIVENESAARK
jgi:uncharacterized protein YdhG (YjbR/CyaY superfamily)